jgi:hypothetical protein
VSDKAGLRSLSPAPVPVAPRRSLVARRCSLSFIAVIPEQVGLIIPDVPRVARLHRTVADASPMTDNAEGNMTNMTIPQISRHSTLIAEAPQDASYRPTLYLDSGS